MALRKWDNISQVNSQCQLLSLEAISSSVMNAMIIMPHFEAKIQSGTGINCQVLGKNFQLNLRYCVEAVADDQQKLILALVWLGQRSCQTQIPCSRAGRSQCPLIICDFEILQCC
jgi:hypothetical protein